MITVSVVTDDDIPAVKDVLSHTWSDTYSESLTETEIKHITNIWHHPGRLRSEARNPRTYFAVARSEKGQIVGLVTMSVATDSSLAYLSRLYVLPGFQRQGIGKLLLQAAIASFAGIDRVQLDVEEQNRRARDFYAKMGFEQIGKRTEEILGTHVSMLVLESVVRT